MKPTAFKVLFLKQQSQQSKPQRKGDEEHRLQCACIRWFALQYPDLRPLLFAIPNGGRRDKVTAAKLKAEGVFAGVADLCLLLPRQGAHALFIEMKTPKGRQAPSQRSWQALIEAQGYRYEVIRTFSEFQHLINHYLISPQ